MFFEATNITNVTVPGRRFGCVSTPAILRFEYRSSGSVCLDGYRSPRVFSRSAYHRGTAPVNSSVATSTTVARRGASVFVERVSFNTTTLFHPYHLLLPPPGETRRISHPPPGQNVTVARSERATFEKRPPVVRQRTMADRVRSRSL